MNARLTSVEDLVDEVENTKKMLKMLNPKTLIAAIALVMGGSVGGNTVLDSINSEERVIKEEVNQQDERIDVLLNRINELESEKKY